ncbi:MAG: ribosome silencing factor [Desulfobacteraceae bacterium]|nr:ribosome silencing factor [Desulfobacteraceae bacterium]MBC2756622.1 ribosome silencing factor [Desulfobacteraceae bacterium]
MTPDVLNPSDVLDPSIQYFIKAALGRKARDLLILDVRAQTSFTDVFLICSGKSNRQVTAIAEHIKMDLKKNGIAPISVEGLKDGHWVLLDYGHILVHVFLESVREFYDLEGFWASAERISVEDYVDITGINENSGAAES